MVRAASGPAGVRVRASFDFERRARAMVGPRSPVQSTGVGTQLTHGEGTPTPGGGEDAVRPHQLVGIAGWQQDCHLGSLDVGWLHIRTCQEEPQMTYIHFPLI